MLERKRKAANPEKFRAAVRKWRAANVEKAREACRRWRKANPEKQAAAMRAWQQANPERVKAARIKWAKENPERWRELRRVAHQNRKARKKGLGTIRSAAVDALWGACAGRCVYCRRPASQLDHVIPLARGGQHHIDNLVPACARCNVKKKAKWPAVWLVEQMSRRAA